MVRKHWTILNDTPKIRTMDGVVPERVCDDIIAWGRDKLIPGKVVNSIDGKSIADSSMRTASVAKFDEQMPHYEKIADGINALTGINKNRFEKLTLTHYTEGQFFKTHQDYFIELDYNENYTNETNIRCQEGGNRVSTIILYLNTVDEGGETHFPWLDIAVKPLKGRLCQFDYDYDEWESNVRTQHAAVPVISGEKWIITIWVREKALTEIVENYKKFQYESVFLKDVDHVNYSMVCGPDWDKRTLNITLPGNDSPMNGLAIAVTGGVESSLLLYLISVLNSTQLVPYQIVPIVIATQKEGDTYTVVENLHGVKELIRYINSTGLSPSVQDPFVLIPENTENIDKALTSGYNQLFTKTYKELGRLRFTNFKHVYLGDNELPNDDDPRWEKLTWSRVKSPIDLYMQPFFNLQKYHIFDLILKLKLEKILDLVGKCTLNHTTYDEECGFFACNERRWGISKLNLDETYDKYFISKRIDNEK
jgi:prolyl 4-hydroxylase